MERQKQEAIDFYRNYQSKTSH